MPDITAFQESEETLFKMSDSLSRSNNIFDIYIQIHIVTYEDTDLSGTLALLHLHQDYCSLCHHILAMDWHNLFVLTWCHFHTKQNTQSSLSKMCSSR